MHDARRVHGRRRLEEPHTQFREFARPVGVQPQLAPGPCRSQYPDRRVRLEQMIVQRSTSVFEDQPHVASSCREALHKMTAQSRTEPRFPSRS